MRRLASSDSRLRPLVQEGCERRSEGMVVARWLAVDPEATEPARVSFNNEFSGGFENSAPGKRYLELK
jgi:hypothetical protein